MEILDPVRSNPLRTIDSALMSTNRRNSVEQGQDDRDHRRKRNAARPSRTGSYRAHSAREGTTHDLAFRRFEVGQRWIQDSLRRSRLYPSLSVIPRSFHGAPTDERCRQLAKSFSTEPISETALISGTRSVFSSPSSSNSILIRAYQADILVPCGGRPESVNITNVSKMWNSDGVTNFKYLVEGGQSLTLLSSLVARADESI